METTVQGVLELARGTGLRDFDALRKAVEAETGAIASREERKRVGQCVREACRLLAGDKQVDSPPVTVERVVQLALEKGGAASHFCSL